MIDVTTKIEIARPVPEVFAFVADQTNAPKWQTDLHEVRRLTDGPIGAGSQSQIEESVYSAGQLARMWDRPVFLVQPLISEGKLAADEHGRITNTSLRAYYQEHGTP